ncbi:MAG: hypothetical protein U0797_11515 [Gemmataceae bacterium]
MAPGLMPARRWLGPVALLVAFALLAGCAKPTGSVSGKVTHKGKELPSGTVTYFTPDNQVVAAQIGSDGTYSIPKLTAGKAKISVKTPQKINQPPSAADSSKMMAKMDPSKMKGTDTSAGASASAPKAPTPGVPIPSKYGDPETSNLTFDVKAGANNHDIVVD